MPTVKKENEVALLEEKLKSASGVVITDYIGMSAQEMWEMRKELHEQGLEFRIVKNRLARIAAERAGVEIGSYIEGPTGICFGYDDPAVPFKATSKLSKKFKQCKLNGGIFDGLSIPKEDVDRYANLPTREEALSKLAAVFQAPAQKLAVAMAGNARNLAVVLSEVAKTKE